MKQAYVVVTNVFLRSMLRLPKTVEVKAIIIDRKDYRRDMFTVFLEGDGLPDFTEVARGDLIPEVQFVYERTQGDMVPNVKLKEITLKGG